MKIILKEDIIGLGYKNDVVEVKNGYGRNYLIPQKKGVIASPSALKQLAETLRQQAHKIEVLKSAAEKRAAQRLCRCVCLSGVPACRDGDPRRPRRAARAGL